MAASDLDRALLVLQEYPAARTTYEQWLNVGMALKDVGATLQDWMDWSASDPRFKPEEMPSKWDSFTGEGITVATIFQYAKDAGVRVPSGSEPIVRAQAPVERKVKLTPVQQARAQVAALFEPGETLALENANQEGRPCGRPRFVARDILLGLLDAATSEGTQELADVEAVRDLLQEPPSPHGIFLCANPLDGSGRRSDNVTAYRHVLIEGDEQTVREQLECLAALGLPCSTVTMSGHKSAHALVRVDATGPVDYEGKFRTLAALCSTKGIKADPACKNPTRLTRLAGVRRDGNLQELLDHDPKASWADFQRQRLPELLEELAPKPTGLPDADGLQEHWGEDLRAPVLIEGVLRRGHVGIIAGPSKVGKSWCAIGLAVAVATGGEWLKLACAPGRVLYVNFEVDAPSMARRIEKVTDAYWGIQPESLPKDEFSEAVKANVRTLTLRGQPSSSEEFATHVIGQVKRWAGVALVIVDPLYMFSDADENSAGETKKVMAQLYRIAKETGAAVLAVHHYTKGKPGQKNALDRSSGSGVFGRAPDACLDMAPLDVDPEDVTLVDALHGSEPFRITPTLREFAPMEPFNVLYDHPLHLKTDSPLVAALDVSGANQARENKRAKRAAATSDKSREDRAFSKAFDLAAHDYAKDVAGVTYVPFKQMLNVLDTSPSTGVGGCESTVKGHLATSMEFATVKALDVGLHMQGNPLMVYRREQNHEEEQPEV